MTILPLRKPTFSDPSAPIGWRAEGYSYLNISKEINFAILGLPLLELLGFLRTTGIILS